MPMPFKCSFNLLETKERAENNFRYLAIRGQANCGCCLAGLDDSPGSLSSANRGLDSYIPVINLLRTGG